MEYVVERRIPKLNARGQITPKLTTIEGIIEYYPTQGTFFFPESLGTIIGGYLDFYQLTAKESGDKFLCFITDGCPITGRKVSPHRKPNRQKELRVKGRASVSISLSDFNGWYLNLDSPAKVSKRQGYARLYHGVYCSFEQTEADGRTTKTQTGIMMNLDPIATGKTNDFANLAEIVPEWELSKETTK